MYVFFLIPLLHKERSLLNHQYNSYKGAVEVRGDLVLERSIFPHLTVRLVALTCTSWPLFAT